MRLGVGAVAIAISTLHCRPPAPVEVTTHAPRASASPAPVAKAATATPASSSPASDAVPDLPAEPSAVAKLQLPRGGREIFPEHRLVGFCGTPGAPALGRL